MVWHDDGHWSDVPCNYHLSYTCKKGFCESLDSKIHLFQTLSSNFIPRMKETKLDLHSFLRLAASCGEPPTVPNAQVFGKKRPRYETNSQVRYYCDEGFVQKLNPVIKCLPGGQWEEPLITCIPGKSMNGSTSITS